MDKLLTNFDNGLLADSLVPSLREKSSPFWKESKEARQLHHSTKEHQHTPKEIKRKRQKFTQWRQKLTF